MGGAGRARGGAQLLNEGEVDGAARSAWSGSTARARASWATSRTTTPTACAAATTTGASWLPDGWAVPLSWDYMVQNVSDVDDVGALPMPLRTWRARASRPTRTRRPRRSGASTPAPALVSARLTPPQSRQLIEAYYLLTVERVQGEVARACELILFRYAFERGYLARHVGKYDQEAKHVGNGDAFRQFRSMSDRYSPHNLPASVLNALCGKDGKLRARGSKGSRSKKAPIDQRWRPSRRMTRTSEDEMRMRML